MINVGGYRLEGQLGAGSTGTGWKAFREGPIAHPVALKVLRVAGGAVDVQRMRREAAILAELDHPHVVRVIEILEDANGIAIAMQYAPGGSFEMLLAERGRLTPGELVAVAAPLASALASAHRRGAVHGDVKPANVLFTSDGEPLLSDFGAVRTLGRLTSESFASTPDYVAPELLDGATPDARTDVYSLAVVAYHALTGTPPYTGDTPLAIVRAADLGSYEPLVGRSGSCYFASLGTARPVTEAPAAACQSGGQGPSYYTRTAPDGSTENAVCWQQGASIRDNHLNSSDVWLQLEAGGWMNALYFADWASATDGLPPC